MENTVIAKNEFIRVLRYYGQKNGKVILEFIRSTTETEFFLFNFFINSSLPREYNFFLWITEMFNVPLNKCPSSKL